MKKILIDEKGRVIDTSGTEFECVPQWVWVECVSENPAIGDEYNPDTKETVSRGLERARTPDGRRERFEIAREVAYGKIGEQLDMLYADFKNGTTTWVDKISAVKQSIPKVPKPDNYPELNPYIPPVDI